MRWWKNSGLALSLILIVGLGLRIYRINYLELFGDEIDAGLQSYSILRTRADYKGHFLPVYMQSFSEWRAPLMMYWMVPFVKVFGLNEWGVRLPAAVAGVVGIGGIYAWSVAMGIKRRTGLIVAAILCILPWNIQYGRAAFELTLMTALLAWGGYFMEKKKLVVGAVCWGLSLYAYNTANVYVPLLVLGFWWLRRWRLREMLMMVGTLGLVGVPLVGQIFLGHAGDRFKTVSILSNKEVVAEVEHYQNAAKNSPVAKVFFNKYLVAGKRIIFNYTNAFGSAFLFGEGDVTFRHSLHKTGNLYWILLPLILLGWSSTPPMVRWWLLIAPIPASLTIDGYNHASRLFWLMFPVAIMVALGWSNLKSNWLRMAMVIVLMGEVAFFQYYYWNYYRNESWRWWHTGYKEAISWVKDNQSEFDHIYLNNSYEPTLGRYLFWTKYDPVKIKEIGDAVDSELEYGRGYCLNDQKTCLTKFYPKIDYDNLPKDTLLMLSAEKDVGSGWDWRVSPPSGVKLWKTIENYQNEPIFYLVSGRR